MTGPPKGEIKLMTPFPIAEDPPPSKPIPDVVRPDLLPAERAVHRFSLAGKSAIGQASFFTLGHTDHITKSRVAPKALALSAHEHCWNMVYQS